MESGHLYYSLQHRNGHDGTWLESNHVDVEVRRQSGLTVLLFATEVTLPMSRPSW